MHCAWSVPDASPAPAGIPLSSTLAIRTRRQPVYAAEPPFCIDRVVADRVAVPWVKGLTLAIPFGTVCGLQGVLDSLDLQDRRRRLPGGDEVRVRCTVRALKITPSCRSSPNCHHNRVHDHREITCVVYPILRSIDYRFPPRLSSRRPPCEDPDRATSEPGRARKSDC